MDMVSVDYLIIIILFVMTVSGGHIEQRGKKISSLVNNDQNHNF